MYVWHFYSVDYVNSFSEKNLFIVAKFGTDIFDLADRKA